MKTEGCAWTLDWNCGGTGQEGGIGTAYPDGSTGYKCCCEQGYWKHAAMPPATGGDYWSSGYHRNLTVYHQTSPAICKMIMASNFRLGRGGLCGKAINFALSPQATASKAITSNSHGGCMIEAVVDIGRQGFYHAGDRGPSDRFPNSCGPYNEMNAQRLHARGYDSIIMGRGDGNEIIIFEPGRVLSKKRLPFNCNWMCGGGCQRHWEETNCRR